MPTADNIEIPRTLEPHPLRIKTLLGTGELLAVLDTMIPRTLIHEERVPEWFFGFQEAKRQKIHFALHDVSLLEIFDFLERANLSPAQVKRGIDRINSILSSKIPFIGSNRDMYALAGIFPKGSTVAVGGLRRRFINDRKGFWKELRRTGSPFQLPRGKDSHPAGAILEEIRQGHCECFARLSEALKTAKTATGGNITPENRADRALYSEDGTPLELRMDLPFKLFAQYSEDMTAGKTPLNLQSKGRRNDGPDLDLISAVSLPAYVITSEERWVNRAKTCGSFQSSWVMTPEVFLAQLRSGLVPQLDSKAGKSALPHVLGQAL